MVFRVPAFIERKLACFGSSESLLIRHVLLFIGVFGVDDDDLGLHFYSEILRSLGQPWRHQYPCRNQREIWGKVALADFFGVWEAYSLCFKIYAPKTLRRAYTF